ncbi:GNAT family N-acetyltransferase [Bacillus mycoides]|uniref:GNAT family N-acetyltransferase n=1 Tax=Bacillus mycoides TaxID=1405 RepID=UPI003D064212
MYQINVCSSLEDVQNKKNEWLNFEKKINNQNITTSYYWIESFLKVFFPREDNQFGYKKKIIIIFLYKEGELIAIAPLIQVVHKKYGIKLKMIEFIGQQWGGTFIDIIGRGLSEEDVDHIMGYVYSNYKFDLLHLKYIRKSTENFDLNSKDAEVLSGCPYLVIEDFNEFDEYKNQIYSKKLKQNIRTAFNKMKKKGLTYDSVIERINNQNFEEIVRISRSKLEDGKGSIYLDEDKKKFVKTIIDSLPSEVIFGRVNNDCVAYRLNLFFNDIKFCFDAAYDREFRNLELGTLSVEESIKDSFKKNIKLHSEGAGTDFYKLKFMKEVEQIYTYTKKGNTLLSFIHYKRHLIKVRKNND